jgi:hypothetical protein
MRKLIVAVVTVVFFAIASCSKDKAAKPTDSVVVCDSIGYTYALHVKPILDNNCSIAGCHGSVGYQDNVQLHDYATSKSAFETSDVICTVKWETGCSQMPSGGSRLEDSLITVLECWKNNGYPQ